MSKTSTACCCCNLLHERCGQPGGALDEATTEGDVALHFMPNGCVHGCMLAYVSLASYSTSRQPSKHHYSRVVFHWFRRQGGTLRILACVGPCLSRSGVVDGRDSSAVMCVTVLPGWVMLAVQNHVHGCIDLTMYVLLWYERCNCAHMLASELRTLC